MKAVQQVLSDLDYGKTEKSAQIVTSPNQFKNLALAVIYTAEPIIKEENDFEITEIATNLRDSEGKPSDSTFDDLKLDVLDYSFCITYDIIHDKKLNLDQYEISEEMVKECIYIIFVMVSII